MSDITDAKGSNLLRYGLFGATAYATTDRKLVGYGIGFGTQKFAHYDGKDARNLVILGGNLADDVLVLGKGSIKVTTGYNTPVQAKDKLKTNCTIPNKTFVLSVHYNATDDDNESFLYVKNVQQYKFKAKKSVIKARILNLRSISHDSVLHYSHTLNGNIYHFSVD